MAADRTECPRMLWCQRRQKHYIMLNFLPNHYSNKKLIIKKLWWESYKNFYIGEYINRIRNGTSSSKSFWFVKLVQRRDDLWPVLLLYLKTNHHTHTVELQPTGSHVIMSSIILREVSYTIMMTELICVQHAVCYRYQFLYIFRIMDASYLTRLRYL